MSWKCHCGCINVNLSKYCNYCRGRLARITLRPKGASAEEGADLDDWDEIVRERQLHVLDKKFRFNTQRLEEIIRASGASEMTPQEQLFAELFNHETNLVKDMDTLTLRAHRENLSKIAFEARARISAVDEEEKRRKPKKTDQGFQRSVNADDFSRNAINTIDERQKRLTKREKLLAGLKGLGIDAAKAEQLLTSGAILAQSKVVPVKSNGEPSPKFVNPFAKKDEDK